VQIHVLPTYLVKHCFTYSGKSNQIKLKICAVFYFNLFFACSFKHYWPADVRRLKVDYTHLLLEFGAETLINARDNKGCTPLHYAALDGYLVQVLLDKGADTSAVNVNNHTALQMACLAGCDASVLAFFNKGIFMDIEAARALDEEAEEEGVVDTLFRTMQAFVEDTVEKRNGYRSILIGAAVEMKKLARRKRLN